MVITMTDVVFEVIGVVIQGIKGFVFNFPSGSDATHCWYQTTRLDFYIVDPNKMARFIIGFFSQYSRKLISRSKRRPEHKFDSSF